MLARLDTMRRWPMGPAWQAAASVAALYFDVDRLAIQAPSRGRGPRPAGEVWLPKKVAIYLAVMLTDADCAGLARYLGMHRSTVARHCGELRIARSDSPDLDGLIENLRALAVAKLQDSGGGILWPDHKKPLMQHFMQQLDHASRSCDPAA